MKIINHKSIITVVLLIVILLLASCTSSREYLDDLYIDIPDTEQQLLIKEWRFLLGSGAEVYYIPSVGAKPQFLGRTTGGDDGYCPFHDGKFHISYSEGVVTLNWAFDGSDDTYSRSESFTLADMIDTSVKNNNDISTTVLKNKLCKCV